MEKILISGKYLPVSGKFNDYAIIIKSTRLHKNLQDFQLAYLAGPAILHNLSGKWVAQLLLQQVQWLTTGSTAVAATGNF